MSLGALVSILGGVISVAAITALVSSNNTADIIKNLFDGFAGSLRAALGKSQ